MTPAERVAIREAIAKLEEALGDERPEPVLRYPCPRDCPRCAKYGVNHDTVCE